MAMRISSELEEKAFQQLVHWATYCLPIGIEKVRQYYQHYLQWNQEIIERKEFKGSRSIGELAPA